MEIWDFSNYILMFTPDACVICGEPTCWIELSFEAPLHPGPCDVAMWEGYFAAGGR